MKYTVENIHSKPVWMPGGVKLSPGKQQVFDLPVCIVGQLKKGGLVKLTKVVAKKRGKNKKDTATG